MQNKIKPELLAPAGDLEKLKIAVLYGADAVYIGGEAYSLRAKAKISIKKLWRKVSALPMNMVRKYMSQLISLLTMRILKAWLTTSKKSTNWVQTLY